MWPTAEAHARRGAGRCARPRPPLNTSSPLLHHSQILTILGYLHVCFQPLVVNTYLFHRSQNPDARSTVLRLCVAGGMFMAARLPGLASSLGNLLNPAWARKAAGSGFDLTAAPWPDLPPAAASGVPALCAMDALCGRRLCSFMGTRHVAWSLPLTVSEKRKGGRVGERALCSQPDAVLGWQICSTASQLSLPSFHPNPIRPISHALRPHPLSFL